MAAGRRPVGLLTVAGKTLQRAVTIHPRLDEPGYNLARVRRMQAEIHIDARTVFKSD